MEIFSENLFIQLLMNIRVVSRYFLKYYLRAMLLRTFVYEPFKNFIEIFIALCEHTSFFCFWFSF